MTFRVSIILAIISILMQVLVVIYVHYTNDISADLVLKMRKQTEKFYMCNANVFGTIFDTVVNSPPAQGKSGILRYFDGNVHTMASLFSRKQMIDRRPAIELGAVFFLIHCLLIIAFLFVALNEFENFISIFLWIRNMFSSYDYLLADMMTSFVEMRVFDIDFSNMLRFYTSTARPRTGYKQFSIGPGFEIEMCQFTYMYGGESEFRLVLERPLLFQESDVVLFDGSSGSGKTTLLKIIRSIHPVDIDLRYRDSTEKHSKWRNFPNGWQNLSASICFCQQSGTTFVDSDMYHIVSSTFEGDDSYNRENVETAMTMARVPRELWGRSSITQETVSGGERQRISIARNIYRILNATEKRIVILDEIDANLNEATALEVFNRILELCSNKLVFIVAHSPAIKSLPQITKIITVDAGRIAQ
jgi:ABC-type lipoprotein export system ATPase subunit